VSRAGLSSASLIALVVASAACGVTPPSGFGVNVEATLPDGLRARVASVHLRVSGVEPFESELPRAVPLLRERGLLRFHYIPARARAGKLSFEITASDDGAALVAGARDEVTLGESAAAIHLSLDPDYGPSLDDDGGAADAGDDGGADGPPPRALGERCTTDGECGPNGHCADGRCCDSRCDGACVACDLPGREGRCGAVARGEAPRASHPRCAVDAVESCGSDGTCDGAGQCRSYPQGTSCGAGSCDPGVHQETPPPQCDGRGRCVPSTPIVCAPFRCAGARCASSCSGDGDCLAPASCVAGSCGARALGASCSTDGECLSGHCADGVCCNSACSGSCQICNGATRGECVLVAAGEDPRGRCPTGMGVDAVCSPGGCDGAGACRVAPPATVCRNASCTAGVATAEARCEASGRCGAAVTTSCDRFTCGPTACRTTCSGDGDCASGYFCLGGDCVAKRAPGGSCGAPSHCTTGFCVGGVCCGEACDGGCGSCGDGRCTPQPAGTECASRSCSRDRLAVLAASRCSGASTICPPQPVETSCPPYRCDPSSVACYVSCAPGGTTGSAKCASPATCMTTCERVGNQLVCSYDCM